MKIKSFLNQLIIISLTILLIAYSISKYTKYKISISNPRFSNQKQIEFNKKLDNLYSNGTITSEGWSRHAIWNYKRNYIKSFKIFIKEWDYYISYIQKYNIWIAVTFSDLGYASMISLSIIDCNLKNYSQIEDISLFSLGNLNLPSNSLDNHMLIHKSENMNITISKTNEVRKIVIISNDFKLPNGEKGLNISLEMVQVPAIESINIQTTWAHNRNLFYLNEKINGMTISKGNYNLGKSISGVIKRKNSENIFTTLDWGRGVWAYEGTWYWSSGTGFIDGIKIGFNFGYGFSDRSPATENCIFYDDKIHKLNNVIFDIPNNEKDLCVKDKFWIIKSDDDRVNLKFWPEVNRQGKFNYGIIKSEQNQVFGVFEGIFILDNGKKINIKNLHGFAEKVFNRW